MLSSGDAFAGTRCLIQVCVDSCLIRALLHLVGFLAWVFVLHVDNLLNCALLPSLLTIDRSSCGLWFVDCCHVRAVLLMLLRWSLCHLFHTCF